MDKFIGNGNWREGQRIVELDTVARTLVKFN